MQYYMPTRIYCEDGCVSAHAEELASLGRCALIVTGGGSAKRNGSLDDVKAALDRKGCSYELFDGIEENPSVETVFRGAEAGRAAGADFVIGIGGGSPLDAAKAIALLITNPRLSPDELFVRRDISEPLPVAAVPTTCGTGSEATGVAVLTRHDIGTKGSMIYRVFPKLALCDGRYLLTAPKSLIANTAVDALGHLLESRLNTTANDLSIVTADGGLRLWSRSIPVLIGEKQPDSEELKRLMNASTAAGIAIAQTGTGIPHALSYTLTYEAGIPHGRAVGYFLAPFVSFCEKHEAEKALNDAGFSNADELDSFIRTICEESPLDRGLLSRAAQRAARDPAKLASAPFDATSEVISQLAFMAAQ